jgi:hypothetical protein
MRTGGFELGSCALTSSTLKWLHRIQCGLNVEPGSKAHWTFKTENLIVLPTKIRVFLFSKFKLLDVLTTENILLVGQVCPRTSFRYRNYRLRGGKWLQRQKKACPAALEDVQNVLLAASCSCEGGKYIWSRTGSRVYFMIFWIQKFNNILFLCRCQGTCTLPHPDLLDREGRVKEL